MVVARIPHLITVPNFTLSLVKRPRCVYSILLGCLRGLRLFSFVGQRYDDAVHFYAVRERYETQRRMDGAGKTGQSYFNSLNSSFA